MINQEKNKKNTFPLEYKHVLNMALWFQSGPFHSFVYVFYGNCYMSEKTWTILFEID